MNAQFATIESLVSVSVVIAFISFGSVILNGSNASFYSSSRALNSNIAGYDFVQQLYQNKSFASCLSQTNSSARYLCAESYVSEYKNIYQAGNVAIVVGNATFGNSSQTNFRACAQFTGTGAKLTACLLEGG